MDLDQAMTDLLENSGGRLLRLAYQLSHDRSTAEDLVQQALESGPKYFIELMEGIGTDDGRALTLELDRLQRDGILGRGSNGEWLLKPRTA